MRYSVYTIGISASDNSRVQISLHTETSSREVADAAMGEAAKFSQHFVLLLVDGKLTGGVLGAATK